MYIELNLLPTPLALEVTHNLPGSLCLTKGQQVLRGAASWQRKLESIRERQLPPEKWLGGGRDGRAGFKAAVFSRNPASMYFVLFVKA